MTRVVGWIAALVASLAALDAATFPTTDGVAMAFNGVRVIAMALGWYLLLTTAVGLAARLLHLRRAVRVTDLATVPFVRRLLNGAAGIAVVASLAAPGVAMAQAPPKPPPPVMHLIDGAPPAPSAPAALAPPPAAAPSSGTYTIVPGDCLWRIADRLLSAQLGRPATDAEVVPALHALIAANADALPRPDLVFAGHVLRVPTGSVPPQLPRTD